jgi:hypothetical protein
VMLGDAERPAKFGALGFCVRVRGFSNRVGGNSRFAFGAVERVFLNAIFVSLKAAGGMFDEFFVGEPGGDNFAPHRVGE